MKKKATFEDTNIGDELPAVTTEVTQEKINRYAQILGNMDSHHVDADAAAQTIYGVTIAQGVLLEAWFSKMMLNWLASPRGWLSGGKLSIKFIRPVYPGDTIAVRGRVIEKVASDKRVVCELAMENQAGEAVVVGKASALC
jgi:acyl dehydratase